MLTRRCLENIKKIASYPHQKANLADLGDDRILEFYSEMADQFIPISNHAGRFEKAKYLLWHFENLLPAVQRDLINFVLGRWPQNLPVDTETTDSETPQTNMQATPAKDPATGKQPEAEPGKKAVASRPYPNPLQQAKQDWFDTLLNWMAVLANLLPLRA